MENILDLSWVDFNHALQTITDHRDAKKLLDKERKTHGRIFYIARLYGRFSHLRMMEEKENLGIAMARRRRARS